MRWTEDAAIAAREEGGSDARGARPRAIEPSGARAEGARRGSRPGAGSQKTYRCD